MKKISNIIGIVSLLVIMWAVASTIDVNNCNHVGSEKDFAAWNIWAMLLD